MAFKQTQTNTTQSYGNIPVNNTYQNTITPQQWNNQTSNQKQQEQKVPPIEIEATFLHVQPKQNKKTFQLMQGTDKNGNAYTIYEVIFNVENSMYNKVFSVFNDLRGSSLKIKDLVVEQKYRVLYNQETGVSQNGQPFKKNNLFFVGNRKHKTKPYQVPPMQNPGAYQRPILNQSSHQQGQSSIRQPLQQSTLNTPKNNEEYQYDTNQGQEYLKYQTPLQKAVNSMPYTKEEFAVWTGNREFNTYEEWMQVAEESGEFDNEERATQVWNILSK